MKNESNDGYTNKDGYTNTDGYVIFDGGLNISIGFNRQINVKLSEQDMIDINEINKDFFENEITNSTLARILIRKAIKQFKLK